MLSRMLVYVSTVHMPTLILGDFNEDILSQYNSSIVNFMSNYGYTQLVTTPNTAKVTLIDRVYYNGPADSIVVEVHDTNFSDHETIYTVGFVCYTR